MRQEMQLTHFPPGVGNAPPMQTFRCLKCGEVQGLATNALGARVRDEDDDQLELHHVAASFRRAREGFIPGLAVECPDADLAVRRAALMLREKRVVGVVAFSRRVDPVTGAFRSAVISKTFGEVPKGF